jgi:hypothetical protein
VSEKSQNLASEQGCRGVADRVADSEGEEVADDTPDALDDSYDELVI